MRPWETLRFAATILSFGVTLGCGRSDMAEVSGKVLFKGGTVPQAGVRVVQFQPAEDSPATIRKAASGEISEDGSFVAFTRKPGDGVIIGKYDVTFSVWPSEYERKSLIDLKYTKASTTPYHVTIDDDVSDLQFEIEPIKARSKARR